MHFHDSPPHRLSLGDTPADLLDQSNQELYHSHLPKKGTILVKEGKFQPRYGAIDDEIAATVVVWGGLLARYTRCHRPSHLCGEMTQTIQQQKRQTTTGEIGGEHRES